LPTEPAEVAEAPMGDVAVAWVHGDQVDASFFHSFIAAQMHDVFEGGLRIGRTLPVRCASGGLVKARNQTVKAFLEGDEQWLFWVDTDMGFAADSLHALLTLAHPADRPIVGGLCFAQMERDHDGMGGFITEPIPTLYKWAELGDGVRGFVSWRNYPRNAMCEVNATGSAFILIHRSVFEAIRDQFGDTWYDQLPAPDGVGLLGEDLSFCVKARRVQKSIFVHTGIHTTHRKPRWLGEADYIHPDDLAEFEEAAHEGRLLAAG
jgi:hypothetical protein